MPYGAQTPVGHGVTSQPFESCVMPYGAQTAFSLSARMS